LVDELFARLQVAQFTPRTVAHLDELSRAVAEGAQNGTLRAVVAAGGDGTAALVVNHTPPGVPLALLPLGTENLLAKHLRITAVPEQVCEIIQQGACVQFDAGQANDRVFLLMVGVGFDGDVVRRLHARRTGHIRHLSYTKPILASIRSYSYPELRVYCHDSDQQEPGEPRVRARWVHVFNLPQYGGGIRLAPWADGRDGRLDVCTFRRGSLWHGLRYLAGVLLGRHRTWRDCETFATTWLRCESDEPVPYQVDGDPAGELPVDIRVLPQRLTILVPPDWKPT
jgi:diacylglycerol kinase family enzyme